MMAAGVLEKAAHVHQIEMTTTDIVGMVRDALVLIFMFALRIGVPLLITLLIGIWLQKVLQEPEGEPEPVGDKAKGGPYCWELKPSSESERARAAAARMPDLPCWLALQVGGDGLTESCYTCPLFSPHAPAPVRI